jgi:hypothetical protein
MFRRLMPLLCSLALLSPGAAVDSVVGEETGVVNIAGANEDGGACGMCRAGHPRHVHRWAMPSNTRRDGGYYVGGGLPVRGDARCAQHEGTWGWDYAGLLYTKRVALNWSHGSRHQGGTGAYKTDGPKLRHE